jgi:predicted aldo/keto reductase-like oxidoreductase
MTAGDCYRFCLSSPHVDVALTGPATRAQLEENLAAIERGPLTAEETLGCASSAPWCTTGRAASDCPPACSGTALEAVAERVAHRHRVARD